MPAGADRLASGARIIPVIYAGTMPFVEQRYYGGIKTTTSFIGRLLGWLEASIYLIVVFFLLLMVVLTLWLVVNDLLPALRGPYDIHLIHGALNNLLLTFILAELIQIVIVYMQKKHLDMQLLLATALTAMIRHVLVFGVEPVAWEEMVVTALLIAVTASLMIAIEFLKIRHARNEPLEKIGPG
jgi:uncharacterized membrane protein (DUF373 family)